MQRLLKKQSLSVKVLYFFMLVLMLSAFQNRFVLSGLSEGKTDFLVEKNGELFIDEARLVLACTYIPEFKGKTTAEQKILGRISVLSQGHKFTMWFDEEKKDRYGGLKPHLIRDDGLWLQKDIVSKGFAVVFCSGKNNSYVKELLEAEKQAIENKARIWTKLEILDAKKPSRIKKGFRFVEGKVLSVKETGGKLWLNFGNDWETDFTVFADRKVLHLLKKQHVNLQEFENSIIRVRGWVKNYNGPSIELLYPEQIQIISDETARKTE